MSEEACRPPQPIALDLPQGWLVPHPVEGPLSERAGGTSPTDEQQRAWVVGNECLPRTGDESEALFHRRVEQKQD